MSDEANSGGTSRQRVPSFSRITRAQPRSYRSLERFRPGDRAPRQKRLRALAELLGALIERHGVTDGCRQQALCLYWPEIAGAKLAPRTWPLRLSEGVLHIETESSSWVHELQFHKAKLVTQINAWVDANRVWLGPPPLVVDVRFELGMRKQWTPIADRDQVRRLREYQRRRLRRTDPNVPSGASAADRDVILAETASIADPDLRRIVESVRVNWNR